MIVTAELRWFWSAQAPVGLAAWFFAENIHGCRPGGGRERLDSYLCDPEQTELGIKRRASAVETEVKGLVGLLPLPFVLGGLAGRAELWSKWSSEALKIPHLTLVTVRKKRWLRKIVPGKAGYMELPLNEDEHPLGPGPVPRAGCNVELTQATAPNGSDWWTLGLEAYSRLGEVEDHLRGAVELLEVRQPPHLAEGARQLNYPEWLSALLQQRSRGL